jgi:hypothetical protein
VPFITEVNVYDKQHKDIATGFHHTLTSVALKTTEVNMYDKQYKDIASFTSYLLRMEEFLSVCLRSV